MIKKNKILIGCLALLLVLSVGYALFSETITINGTATAKGSFDITTTCVPGISNELVQMGFATTTDDLQHGFKNDSCEVLGNTITVNAELGYPTARRFFTIKMTNSGSIPAIIWGADEGGTYESLYFSNSVNYSIKNTQTNAVISSGTGQIFNGHIYNIIGIAIPVILDSEGNFNSDNNVIYDSNKKMAGIKLNTGDSAFVLVEFNYENGLESILSDNGKSEYIQMNLNHEFKWEQYTDSPNYESTTFDEWCFDGC